MPDRVTTDRRDAVRQFKRELIIDAAKRTFATRGIDAASMREIAKVAGYTTGAIYQYFTSKEALYAAVLSDTIRDLDAAVLAGAAGDPGGAEGALVALWQFFSDRPADFDLGFYLFGGARPASLTPELDQTLNRHLDTVFVHIADCLVDEGLTSPAEAHRVAVLHGTWIFGLLLMTQTGRLKSLGEAARPLLDLYLTKSLGKNGGTA